MPIFKSDILKNRAVLISGGSGETGRGFGAHFAAAGADVALTWHSNEAGARETAALLEKDYGVKTAVFPHDIYDPEANRTLPRRAAEALGRLDFLVNNAGGGNFTPLDRVDREGWDEAFEGNVNGPFFLAREAALIMREREEGGCVVNIAATSALKASHAAYGIAKATVVEMTKFLAHTFAPRVRVVALVPGLLEISDVNPEARRARAAASPLKRNCGPDDLGATAVALCSPAFAAVTGVSVLVDGGFWLNHP